MSLTRRQFAVDAVTSGKSNRVYTYPVHVLATCYLCLVNAKRVVWVQYCRVFAFIADINRAGL